MCKIKFIEKKGKYGIGDVIEVNSSIADDFVKKGYCVIISRTITKNNLVQK